MTLYQIINYNLVKGDYCFSNRPSGQGPQVQHNLPVVYRYE